MNIFKKTKNNDNSNGVSRADFLKRSAFGAIAIGLFGKEILKDSVTAQAATQIPVSDNLTSNVIVSASAPPNIRCTWIDTSSGGIYKYYDGGSWKPIRSTWG